MLFFVPLCDVYAPVMLPCFGPNIFILGACMLVIRWDAPRVAPMMFSFFHFVMFMHPSCYHLVLGQLCLFLAHMLLQCIISPV